MSKNSLTDTPLDRVTRLSGIGVWTSALALGLAIIVVGVLLSQMLLNNPEYVSILIHDLEIEAYVQAMTAPQRVVAGLLWASVDLLGVWMLWQVLQLFRGFLRGGVFTEGSAVRLRRIGLIVLAMGPVSIFSGTLAGMLISYWQSGNSVHGAISIDDSDIYAIVIGLVITAVSHIMVEAARINRENQAFV